MLNFLEELGEDSTRRITAGNSMHQSAGISFCCMVCLGFSPVMTPLVVLAALCAELAGLGAELAGLLLVHCHWNCHQLYGHPHMLASGPAWKPPYLGMTSHFCKGVLDISPCSWLQTESLFHLYACVGLM